MVEAYLYAGDLNTIQILLVVLTLGTVTVPRYVSTFGSVIVISVTVRTLVQHGQAWQAYIVSDGSPVIGRASLIRTCLLRIRPLTTDCSKAVWLQVGGRLFPSRNLGMESEWESRYGAIFRSNGSDRMAIADVAEARPFACLDLNEIGND